MARLTRYAGLSTLALGALGVLVLKQAGLESLDLARSMRVEGSGFCSREWHESDLIGWILDRGDKVSIITNQAMAVRYLTDHPAIQVPEQWDPVKAQVGPE